MAEKLTTSFRTTICWVSRSEWIGQRAPLRVHDVVQVVVTPWSHFLQTATHCSISFGLYEGYRSVAHLFIVPVASCWGEHEVTTTARASKAAKRRMKPRPADDPMLTPNSDFRQCLPTTVHYRTALFQFPAYKKAGALLNTRYEGSGGRPARIAAPRRSQRNCEQRHCSFHVAGAQRNPDSKATGICALRPTGLKMHSYENARPASPGASKTEPNISHWGVANVVPAEEHAGCCETTTASRVNNSLRRAESSQRPLRLSLADLIVRGFQA